MKSPFSDQTAAFGDLIAYRSTEGSRQELPVRRKSRQAEAALTSLAWQRLTKNKALHAVLPGDQVQETHYSSTSASLSPKRGVQRECRKFG